ncbi:hypothetical protein ZHAS_00010403 [Anopheles sinensis]|uniref:Uncharacterized protein n=1 Tax=Anopheles sinensis TaxID=74873 RepID=A0A084VXH6_ANOSI|nr:hypothetical protein ZHAS_00010403 [Anopheles sinensis]
MVELLLRDVSAVCVPPSEVGITSFVVFQTEAAIVSRRYMVPFRPVFRRSVVFICASIRVK